MSQITIKFTLRRKDENKDSIAYMHDIYRDIEGDTIKESYMVPMNGPFLRSLTESIINQYQQIITDKCGNYVKVTPYKDILAVGFPVNDQELSEITYLLTCSL